MRKVAKYAFLLAVPQFSLHGCHYMILITFEAQIHEVTCPLYVGVKIEKLIAPECNLVPQNTPG